MGKLWALSRWGLLASILITPLWGQGATFKPVHYPKANAPAASTKLKAEIAKGEYLVKLGDCMACHTDHGHGHHGKPFAGGLPIKTPFGTIYSTNITPDKATGIGNWTFSQFNRAVRYGISPHGYLFAAMPYNYYNVLSRKQVREMWAYLKRIPAVNRKDTPVDMPPPFSWRWLQFGWRFAFFKPGEDTFKYNPKHSAQWNRGRFIVRGPEHCGACHTPHNFLGGAEQRHFLQGSSISGLWAPNITSLATGPHAIATIMKVFKDARGLAGGRLKGPMRDAIDHSMRFMKPSDMRAVAVYLQSVASERAAGPSPVPMRDVDLKLGEKTFKATCAECHTTGAGGAPIVGNAKDWKALKQVPLYVLYENVWHGVSIMPAKGGCKSCTSRAITSTIVYMIKHSETNSSGSSESKSSAAKGGKKSLPTDVVSLKVGKKLFESTCSACHMTGALGAPKYGNKADWAARLKAGLHALQQHALHGLGAMPAKGGCSSCTVDEIKSAVDYMVAGSGGKSMVSAALKGKKGEG